jgi:hypothetical protein
VEVATHTPNREYINELLESPEHREAVALFSRVGRFSEATFDGKTLSMPECHGRVDLVFEFDGNFVPRVTFNAGIETPADEGGVEEDPTDDLIDLVANGDDHENLELDLSVHAAGHGGVDSTTVGHNDCSTCDFVDAEEEATSVCVCSGAITRVCPFLPVFLQLSFSSLFPSFTTRLPPS